MMKVFLIGFLHPHEPLDTLKDLIAASLASVDSILDDKKHSPDEYKQTVDNLVEVLGYGQLPDIKLRKEIESIQRELVLEAKSVLPSGKEVIVEPVIDEIPWYNRYDKPSKGKKMGRFHYKTKPLSKKKWTRKK